MYDDPEVEAAVNAAKTPESNVLGDIIFWLIALIVALAAAVVLGFIVLGVVWIFHLLVGLFP